jgi:hypothetical protein
MPFPNKGKLFPLFFEKAHEEQECSNEIITLP